MAGKYEENGCGDSSSWESMDEEEDSCQKILQNNLILEKVFTCLPLPELLKCRLVSKNWNKTALLKNQLGCKITIRITEDHFDQFIKTAQNALLPFCRQFDFHMLDLDSVRLSAFKKLFKHNLNSLSLKFCTAMSSSHPMMKLLNSPNLRELKITGRLPEFGDESSEIFHKHQLQRLTHLDLNSSIDYGHVSQDFIKLILQSSPNLHSISIGRSASLWKGFVDVVDQIRSSKLQDIKLFNLESQVEIAEFVEIQRKTRIHKITFENCIVGQEFLHELMIKMGDKLLELNIQGAQHEILSRAFTDMKLLRLNYLTLPIDGVSTQDGITILQSIPNLRCLKVVGLFQTVFSLHLGQLLSVTVEEFDITTILHPNFRMAVVSEKRREFLKVLSLLPMQPKKLSINLPDFSSQGLRSIYQKYPNIEELIVANNSRQCLDGWTGIPIKICRKIAACKTFSVLSPERVQRLQSISQLKKLKQLELSIFGEPPKSEFTLLYILYGISQIPSLEELRLNNVTMSDIAFLALSKNPNLKSCYINGSLQLWTEFKSSCENITIRSFLMPPVPDTSMLPLANPLSCAHILRKLLKYLPRSDVFDLRLVSKVWHAATTEYLHRSCTPYFNSSSNCELDKYLERSRKSDDKGQSSPNKTPRKVLSESHTPCLTRALSLMGNHPSIKTLILRGMNKSMLEFYQREREFGRSDYIAQESCEDRRKITYWFYPDGNDDLVIPTTNENPLPTSITVIGSWGRKDTGLLEFLNPSFSINSVVLFGLLREVFDVVLPKLTAMQNVESLTIMPFSADTTSEICRNHLQIIANSSFSLKNLSMQKLQVPSETISDFVKSHRFTLETVDIQNHVNVSDRLSFAIPNMTRLQLDEPPGTLLWTTLNAHKGLESIHFERSGYIYNQIKSKAIPKLELELVDQDFKHSATEMLCDVNLFLESVANQKIRAQKSILQEGTDSALRFFTNFRYLTSLTLRSVHAHYGILQGIFQNLTQLEKLVLTNTTGVNDEILTGFPKATLDKMDLLNPLQFRKVQHELHEASYPSIRNLKNLVHLSLDDQPNCSDFSVIFGILKLKQLKYFSCKKWKITDVSIRAIADMTSIDQILTDGSTGISSHSFEYLKTKALNRTIHS